MIKTIYDNVITINNKYDNSFDIEKAVSKAVLSLRQKGFTGTLIGFCNEDTYRNSESKYHVVELFGMRFIENIWGLHRLYFSDFMTDGEVRVQAKDNNYG